MHNSVKKSPADSPVELDHVERVETIDVLNVTQRSPYRDPKFIGTYLAVCLGALSSYGSFVMPATSLLLINADIGPSANITWVALVWTLCLSVGYTLVGSLSDIFGRRWFFIGASSLAVIGCIVGATAKTVNALIGANVLIGLAASGQLSFNYTIAELVPVKDRFFVLSFVFLFAVPFSSFGPYISRLFIVHTAQSWRWDYYLNIIMNALSTILYILFYHPPNFEGLHANRRSKMQELRDLDYIGMFLFIAGSLLFLMGLSWGGSSYAWNSAHVIATIVVGFCVCVAFVLYECYTPCRRPLIPMHLYQNIEYSVLTIITTVGGMLYYSLNVIFPTMVATVFTTDIVYGGLLSCSIGGGVGLGQFLGSLLATPGGHIRWKLIASTVLTTAFTAGLAGAKTRETAVALAVLASVFIGVLESLAVTMVTIVIVDQRELGAAGGAFGSLRSMGGVVATAVLSAVLSNKVTENIKNDLVPALVKAGLPLGSVADFLVALEAGSATEIEAIPGVTPTIIGVAEVGFKNAYSKAFTIVYLVTLAFGGSAIIASWWTPNIEGRLTHDVMRQLGENANNHESKATNKETEV